MYVNKTVCLVVCDSVVRDPGSVRSVHSVRTVYGGASGCGAAHEILTTGGWPHSS